MIQIRQCYGSGVQQPSGWRQNSFCREISKNSVLGRISCSNLVHCSHSSHGQLAGRLPQPAMSGHRVIASTLPQVDDSGCGPPDSTKLDMLFYRYRDPLVKAVDALVT